MDWILKGLWQAFLLLLHGDPEVLGIAWRTLKVSGAATLLSLVLGLPLGTLLALVEFPGRRIALSAFNTGMALPPVVVGLVVSLFLWRSGPLGELGWMYTPQAMVVAQFLIAFPVVVSLAVTALQQLDRRLRIQLLGLGASPGQLVWALWREARLPLLAAVIAAFGSVISEVGASLMVGGNLRGRTRVLTTAIVLENSRGEFAAAIALSAVLLLLAYLITLALTLLQQRGAAQE
ncbi:MAG: ABC transporter permease subunit [Anaerolineae bacterium]|nr:MAG: ABC transporter permease subunit [Anaerolineae bacterium]